jgi:hypothetical protein
MCQSRQSVQVKTALGMINGCHLSTRPIVLSGIYARSLMPSSLVSVCRPTGS